MPAVGCPAIDANQGRAMLQVSDVRIPLHAGDVDIEGDEFYDAGAEPSSPSFMNRGMDRASSRDSDALSFADASSEVSSRAGSFKDAPGPSELWDVSSTGKLICSCSAIQKDLSVLGDT